MRSGIIALAVIGCGRIDFHPLVDGGGNSGLDAPVDACTFGPWSPPVAITELNTGNVEYGGQIAADGLTLYFDSDRTGGGDLYVATRLSRTAAFAAPVRLTSLATATKEGDASPRRDQLELVYSDYASECLLDARRATIADPFGTATQAICSASGAFISRDGLTLYYNTFTDAFGEGELSVTTRASEADPFAAGQPIAELAGVANEGYPALSGDELTMYFESGEPLDIYETTRASPTSPWGTPTPLATINTAMEDGDVSITTDGTELFFESDRDGNPDLFHATRSCL
jgi:hypothetical protein